MEIKIGLTWHTGWWLSHPSEKYARQLATIIPNIWKVIKVMFQTTNQHMMIFANYYSRMELNMAIFHDQSGE